MDNPENGRKRIFSRVLPVICIVAFFGLITHIKNNRRERAMQEVKMKMYDDISDKIKSSRPAPVVLDSEYIKQQQLVREVAKRMEEFDADEFARQNGF